jgi:hypothetical protein
MLAEDQAIVIILEPILLINVQHLVAAYLLLMNFPREFQIPEAEAQVEVFYMGLLKAQAVQVL